MIDPAALRRAFDAGLDDAAIAATLGATPDAVARARRRLELYRQPGPAKGTRYPPRAAEPQVVVSGWVTVPEAERIWALPGGGMVDKLCRAAGVRGEPAPPWRFGERTFTTRLSFEAIARFGLVGWDPGREIVRPQPAPLRLKLSKAETLVCRPTSITWTQTDAEVVFREVLTDEPPDAPAEHVHTFVRSEKP